MITGQEGMIYYQEERVVEGGFEVTRQTLMAANEEGAFVCQATQASVLSQPTSPRVEAWGPPRQQITAPITTQPTPQDPRNVRKKSCSNCLEDFCCLYDINSKWYEFKGKGFWCVLFLLLGYLIAGVLVLAAGVILCVCYLYFGLCFKEKNSGSDDDSCKLCLCIFCICCGV